MPRLSERKVDEIRQSVDIVDVVGNYLSLKKKGRNYVALCPFHDDSNPSLTISPEKQIYMCFVCGNGGNVFNFLKNYYPNKLVLRYKINIDNDIEEIFKEIALKIGAYKNNEVDYEKVSFKIYNDIINGVIKEVTFDQWKQIY